MADQSADLLIKLRIQTQNADPRNEAAVMNFDGSALIWWRHVNMVTANTGDLFLGMGQLQILVTG